MKLPDQAARDEFINKIDTNFSVIAPAGVGKTTAIASRIVNILCGNFNKKSKKSLLAVTYTEKAANELRERTIKLAIEKIKNALSPNLILSEINKVFFGTIHSLAARFIKNYGKHIGISPDFTIDEGQNIWESFLEKSDVLSSFTGKSGDTIVNFIQFLQYIPNVKSDTYSDEELRFIGELLAEFAKFKRNNKTFTYDDLIIIANEISSNADALAEIHSENFSVILDEAQDTDDEQFKFLLKIARQNEEILNFSMVGDPQQAIYSSRANVENYVKLHIFLTNSNLLIEKVFTVTMRCQQQIVDVVNKIFPSVFANNTSHIDFVKLSEKPDAETGTVSKIVLQKISEYDDEASLIVDFFKSKTHSNFEIDSWCEVAILAPRKAQLRKLKNNFEKKNIKVQLHTDENGERQTLSTWLISLLEIVKNKSNVLELAGILSEIFDIKKQKADDLFTVFDNDSNEDNSILEKIIRLQHVCKDLTFCDTANTILQHFDIQNIYKNKFSTSDCELAAEICDFFEILAEIDECSLTVSEILSDLKTKISSNKDCNSIDKDSIQLLTFHKSKGLEWPVVILPFLTTPRKEIPQADYTYDKDLAKKKWIENEQRMLYVAFTRAKKTLMLTDLITDEGYKKMPSNMHTSISLLSNNLFNSEKDFILNLPDFDGCKFNNFASYDRIDASKSPVFLQILPAGEVKIENVKNNLNDIILSLSPSTYSENKFDSKFNSVHENVEDFNEEVNEQNKQNADYGNWWHKMMSNFPWQKRDTFDAYFSNVIIDNPNVERAQREINLLRNNSFFYALNSNLSWQIFTEIPFQWKMSDDYFFDGFIDLLVVDPKSKSAVIIDWKTNSFDNERLFFSKYSKQVSVYRQAIESILHVKVDAKIYSSFAGKFVDMSYENN